MRLTSIFILSLFVSLLSTTSASGDGCEFDSIFSSQQTKELFLKQTQVTALKIASLIEAYNNPTTNEELLKKMDLIRATSSPLEKNQEVVSQLRDKYRLNGLMSAYDSFATGVTQGRVKISYEELPQLLLIYDLSHEKPVFNQSDYVVAWYWNNNEDKVINPILSNLTDAYHKLSRKERETLYQQISPGTQELWAIHEEKLKENGCFKFNHLKKTCELDIQNSFPDTNNNLDSFSSDIMEILSYQLTEGLKENLQEEIEWKLHPPPQETKRLTLEASGILTKEVEDKVWIEYRSQRETFDEYIDKNALNIIQYYHELENKSDYLVLDKEKERLFYFNSAKVLLASFKVPLNEKNDERGSSTLGTLAAGSGIYTITDSDEGSLKLKGSRQNEFSLETLKSGVDCFEGNCSNVLGNIEDILKRHQIEYPLPLYILPRDEKLKFVVKNGQLSFTTYEDDLDYFNYNFTPKSKIALRTTFQIPPEQSENKFVTEFLETLENEKEELMRIYPLDNDEYNDLAILAYGILGQESQFASHWRYRVKETFPGGVAYLKNYKSLFEDIDDENKDKGLLEKFSYFISNAWQIEKDFITGATDLSQNSRGPTQIKNIPDKVEEHYNIKKEDLNESRAAAIATLGFLAQSLEELKGKEKFHPEINGSNRSQYLHYIYMGRSSEIINGTATPERNIYYQNVMRHANELKVWQLPTN